MISFSRVSHRKRNASRLRAAANSNCAFGRSLNASAHCARRKRSSANVSSISFACSNSTAAFWKSLKAQASSDFQKAAVEFEQAKLIDETFAELRFRRAQCALALSDLPKAQLEFAAARNLDALRFRCDTRLNEIIRQKAAGNVTLADAERAMAGVSPDRLPGADFFYEHVHLTFQGNYVLGRVIAEKVEAALSLPQNARWPAIAECAQRLGPRARDPRPALSDMHGRLADVPFTFQFNHDEQVRRLTEMTRQLPL